LGADIINFFHFQLKDELMLLYYRLVAANEELSLLIIRNTYQGVMKMQDDVTNINKGLDQLQKDIDILAMNLEMDGWKTNDIMLENQKVVKLFDQLPVIRDQSIKKKYLTQDVAQELIDPHENNSRKIISLLKLLADCENVVKL